MSKNYVKINSIILRSPLTGEDLFEHVFPSDVALETFVAMVLKGVEHYVVRKGGWRRLRADNTPVPDPKYTNFLQRIVELVEQQNAGNQFDTSMVEGCSLGESFGWGVIIDLVQGTQVACVFNYEGDGRFLGHSMFKKQFALNAV